MEILLIILVVVVAGFFILKAKRNKKNISLKEIVKKSFPNHTIIEKFGTVMICEINHRNEPDELVFIRIEPNKRKNITQTGRRIKVEYPSIPSSKELKSDLKKHLKAKA